MRRPTYYKPLYGPPVAVPGRRKAVRAPVSTRWPGPATGALLAALTIYLSFNAGGFFPAAPAYAAIALCLLLALGAIFVERPLESLTPALALPLALLAGFAVWTLASSLWSEALGRALIEFDRALLYLLAFTFFAFLAPGRGRLEWAIRGLALAAAVVCAAGWVTRVAADVWPISTDVRPERLSFPLTYWNALGLLAALGLVACFHLASSRREQRWVRALAAAAIPLLGSTLLLTYSRASLVLVPVILVVYALAARPRRMLATALAAGPPLAVAMVASYAADRVSSPHFAAADAVAQGHKLAVLVGACVLVAGALRGLMTLQIDRRLEDWVPPVLEPGRVGMVVVGGAVAAVAVALAAGGPSWVSTEYDHFVEGEEVGHHGDPRSRLTSAGSNGRVQQWDVAIEAFEAQPLHGEGSGTYQLAWARHRPYRFTVIDAHSLYVEQLGETGIAGFALIAGTVLSILYGLARRIRGEERQVYAAALALALLWAVHAGIDWDWEMPAVTIWLFAVAGAGLAKPLGDLLPLGAAAADPPRAARIAVAVAVLALALVPAALAISQARLDRAVADARAGDCAGAIEASRASLDVLSPRPEPHEVIGYCDIRAGDGGEAVAEMEAAVDHDPNNWETHYGLGLALASDGQNPLPELEIAHSLNPLERAASEALSLMRSAATPAERESRARLARPLL